MKSVADELGAQEKARPREQASFQDRLVRFLKRASDTDLDKVSEQA
jgi:hypothetical protein